MGNLPASLLSFAGKYPALMKIELVVFDIAGTTLYDDNSVNVAFRQAMDSAGYPVSEREVNDVMGLRKPQAIRMMLEARMPGQHIEEARIDAIHDVFLRNMIAFYREDPGVREMEGASEVFAALHQHGIKVALDTGFSRDITQTILDRLGWERDGLVDCSVCSDEVPAGRPEPYMIQRIMQQLGVTEPQAIAKVGDTPSDLEEGQNAGVRHIIGVTSGAYTLDELKAFPHTHIVDSVKDVLAIVI